MANAEKSKSEKQKSTNQTVVRAAQHVRWSWAVGVDLRIDIYKPFELVTFEPEF